MGIVATKEQIASAYAVYWGPPGAVRQLAQQRGVCRQWIYRQAQQLTAALESNALQLQVAELQAQLQQCQQQSALLEQRLAVAVVLDEETQARFATVGQARGVSLPDCRELLDVLIPGQPLSVATLGRRTQAAGQQAAQLLAVLDPLARDLVRDAAADEIYVSAPVLMVVEQESLCWVTGQLSEEATGAAWEKQFRQLPHLEQLARDAGKGLRKGVDLINEQRQDLGQALVVDKEDHFHALRGGGGPCTSPRRGRVRRLRKPSKPTKPWPSVGDAGKPARGRRTKHAGPGNAPNGPWRSGCAGNNSGAGPRRPCRCSRRRES